MKNLILLSLSLICAPAFAHEQGCEASGPTVKCIEFLYAKSSMNYAEAAQACKGGVSVDCVEFLYAKSSMNYPEAAKACKGGVTVECMQFLYSKSSMNYAEAARACSAN